CGALVVAPEFGTRVQLFPVVERLGIALALPVLGPTLQILRNVEAERVSQLLLLDRSKIEVRRRFHPSFGQRDAIVDRMRGALPEDLTGQELCRTDGRGKFFEQRLAVRAEPEQKVRHEK